MTTEPSSVRAPGSAGDTRGWPLRAAVRLADLGPLAEPIAEQNGQAIAIRPLRDHPGWLAKLYKQVQHPDDAHRIDVLISAPRALSDAERGTLYGGTCWPVARIFEPGQPAVGCVIPMAPEHYRHELRRGDHRERRFVEIDWLAKPDESLGRIGLPKPGSAGRLAACSRLAELATLLERMGLVYSDWSFSNAFWSPDQRSVYLIDVDGCQSRKMPDIHQPGWADPLTAQGTDADTYTDRYRLALLAAKCLTGLRRTEQTLHAVAAAPWPNEPAVPEVLLDMLLATNREQRPTAAQLRQALGGGPYIRPLPKPTRAALPALPAGTTPRSAVAAAEIKSPQAETKPSTQVRSDPPYPRNVIWPLAALIALVAMILLIAIHH